jgi:hypothetical protein
MCGIGRWYGIYSKTLHARENFSVSNPVQSVMESILCNWKSPSGTTNARNLGTSNR